MILRRITRESRGILQIPERSSGMHRKQERGSSSRISRTTQSFNSAMQSRRMRVCLSLLSFSLFLFWKALRSDQASFRFRLSISARFVSRASYTPHPFQERCKRNRGHRGSWRRQSFAKRMLNFPASHNPFCSELIANSVSRFLFSKTSRNGGRRTSLTVEQVSCFELL